MAAGEMKIDSVLVAAVAETFSSMRNLCLHKNYSSRYDPI
jgi:hypothetical protein